MSSRPFVKQFPVIEDGNMSGDITSAVSIVQMISIGAYTYSWSGTSPVGNIQVEVSNDYKPGVMDTDPVDSGTWTPIYFTLNGSSVVNQAPVSGNTGTGVIEFSTGAYAVRTKYVFTSGTGTLQSVVNLKVC